MGSFTVVEVIDSEPVRPVLINYNNENLEDETCCELYKNKDKNVVGVATEKSIYTGDIENDELFNKFILAVHKKTKQAKLIAIDKTSLSLDLPQKRDLKPEKVNSNSTSIMELNKQFGSKRIKRITEHQERSKVFRDSAKEFVEQTIADITVEESVNLDNTSLQENDGGYAPPINRDATKCDEVYQLKNLVPSYVLNSLEEAAQQYLECDPSDINTTQFVKDYIIQLQQTESSDSLSKCKILLYIDSLLKFLVSPARQIANKKYVASEHSQKASDYILENFCTASKTGRTRPISMRDKTICYIMVLSLFVGNFVVNLEDLARETKLKPKKLQEVAKVLALTSDKKDKNLFSLQLPLPAVRLGRAAPKKKGG